MDTSFTNKQQFETEVVFELQNISRLSRFPPIEPLDFAARRHVPDPTGPMHAGWPTERVEAIKKHFENTLKNEEIRKPICAALISSYESIFDLAKVVTPVLITLKVTGVLSEELTPLWAATAILTIGKIGVATLCHDYRAK